jgi:hypothetical protein
VSTRLLTYRSPEGPPSLKRRRLGRKIVDLVSAAAGHPDDDVLARRQGPALRIAWRSSHRRRICTQSGASANPTPPVRTSSIDVDRA